MVPESVNSVSYVKLRLSLFHPRQQSCRVMKWDKWNSVFCSLDPPIHPAVADVKKSKIILNLNKTY